MFEFIRSHRRWMQFILLLLIVPSFFLVGIQGYESFMRKEPELATVAGQPISRAEFDQAHRNQLEQYRQRLGAQFDPAVIDTPQLREALLNQLINQRLLANVAVDNRFSVSDETLRNTIAAIPEVQDNGRFSPERYRQVLAAQGMSPTSFEAGLRRDLAVARVLEPVGQSARAPAEVVASLETALTQQRTVQLRRFAAADFRSQVNVTPADIQAWYDANKEQLQVPEQVQVQYLVLNEAAATEGVQVKDEDLASYYEQNKNRFGQPERRRASHIMIEVPAGASEDARKAARAKAEALATQAAANPAQFAELARKNSQDAGSAANGGDLGWLAPGMLSGPLEKAIFSQSKDQVSGVVESPSGFHVVKVTEIQPAAIKPLAEVKDQITAEVRKQLAAVRFSEMASQLNKQVYDQRDSLQPAADAVGLKLRTASGVTREGLLPADQAGPGSAVDSPDAALLDNPRVRQVLFSPDVLREKQNSGVIELSPDTMLAVRVAAVQPAHVPPLDKVSDSIRAKLLDERSAEAAKKAGEAALAADQANPAAAPEGFGGPLVVSRQDPKNLPRSVLDAVMRLPATKLPAYTGVQSGADYTLVRLEKVEAGTVEAADKERLAQQLAGAWGQAENEALVRMLREEYKVQVLPAAAEAIRGGDASQQAAG
ncbi:SurA N-terminal domain-containing protein [Achromobacter xylosoxidans]|uniref:SurA N-terminal domain-containing protein n=1 Tax=Alcaligenes xylosoxydans xylosoxydans TaxID=85698 RepID=UPI0006C0799F|nr:SurA N-terminal domain-containing protein [Achromobacter xylosoxidans]QQE58237.1 SurA N-terminal domain-containing protein [Achromobacter xylosoxidans]QQV11984.1 SurA N-terminal domain-containing protein [Achromobacter xylosoxidans]UXL07844.1 SurA N-terminal domain-containing protein [Achromobacter xylosoxidans]CUI98406.1 Peptidyl-prolyl cis-trans isomerase D [Achromobacter xylosoxidans]